MTKVILFVAIAFQSVVSFATSSPKPRTPEFSAFTSKGVLYVTVLGDSCNHLAARLEVADKCKQDRQTRNAAPICAVQLSVAMTVMGCDDNSRNNPKVMAIDLNKANVDRNSYVLELSYGASVLEVGINR